MAKYKKVNDLTGVWDSILNKDTGGHIPKDEGNKDYQEYLEWVAEGNTPEEAE